MEKLKAIYVCTIADPWIEVAKGLEESYSIVPAYIMHWRKDTERYQSEFPHVPCFTVEAAWRGKCFADDARMVALDETTLNSIAKEELIALKMMDRLDPTGEYFYPTQREDYFRELLGKWMAVLTDLNIDIVISPSVPHRVFDYALYVACQIMNKKFVMFQMVPFGSRSILLDDVTRMPLLADAQEESDDIVKLIETKLATIRSDYTTAIPEYMKKQSDRSRGTPPLRKISKIISRSLKWKKFLREKPNVYWVDRGRVPQNSDIGWLNFYYLRMKRNAKLARLKQRYLSLATQINTSENYVLVALHYQPEETSCPTGGAYVDQALIVKCLVEALPEQVDIVVKEHKSQFYNFMEGASGRSEGFYDRLKSISPRVKFAALDDNPFELIDKAACVATISGTIGWESAVRGTPALVFGRAWYEGMPGVFKVKSLANIRNAWSAISASNREVINFEEIELFHKKLAKSFIHAKHYKAFEGNDDITLSESADNIVTSIVDYARSHVRKRD